MGACEDILLSDNGLWTREGIAFSPFVDGVTHSENKDVNCIDGNKGKMISANLPVKRKYLVFSAYIGAWDAHTGIRVYVDDTLQFLLSDGIESSPMRRYALDLSGFSKSSVLRIELTDCGTWERVYFQGPLLTDTLPLEAKLLQPIKDCLPLDVTLRRNGGDYVNVPIDTEEELSFYDFSIDGVTVFNKGLRLAKHGKVDFIATIPIKGFEGEEITIYGQESFLSNTDLEAFRVKCNVSKKPYGFEHFYKEKGRPKLHFTPSYGGNGDMLGFYIYNGHYHIGYLLDPTYNAWNSNSAWGYSESDDLFAWKNQRMIIEKGAGTKRSTGCAFVDVKNASGLQKDERAPILLFYGKEQQTGQRYQDFSSHTHFPIFKEMLTQVSVKYSVDGGETFQDYEKNPIFYTQGVGGHDPEVVYYAPEDKYVLVIHDRRNGAWGFDFYESKNLLDWTYMSTSDGWWETPNFYALPLDKNRQKTLWVLQQCNGYYQVGNFDGKRFLPIGERKKTYEGAFSMRTFKDGERRILMAYMGASFQEGFYGTGGATLPMELSLRTVGTEIELFYRPAKELNQYIIERKDYKHISIKEANSLRLKGELWDMEVAFSEEVAIRIGEQTLFEYSRQAQTYRVGNREEGLPIKSVRLIIDGTIVSYYLDDGLRAGCTGVDIRQKDKEISFEGTGFLDVAVKKLQSPFL